VLIGSSCSGSKPAADNALFPVYVGGKCGFVDHTGKLVVAPTLPYVGLAFSGGLGRIIENGDKVGYIDRTGRIVVQP
jgi:hypothetical protein